jgi:hypothetical protein
MNLQVDESARPARPQSPTGDIIVKTNRIRAAAAFAWLGLALASNARAVDLRDWGRKYDTASERFLVLSSFNNEAVLDKETQLVWRRTTASPAQWLGALHNCYSSGAGGRYGWRLPSVSELSSLLGTGGVLPAGHPFLNVPNQGYIWSSTDIYYDTDFAHTRMLTANSRSTGSKDGYYPYLCVRGVGVADRG